MENLLNFRYVTLALFVVVGALGLRFLDWGETPGAASRPETVRTEAAPAFYGGEALQRAFRDRSQGLAVTGAGVVIRTLPDDNDGSRHQRFIIRMDTGQTLLIAHNIDVAPRIRPLVKDDAIEFKGEYEWNARGGVIHWTHHDPAGQHPGGWIKHRGQIYQ